MRPVTGQRWLIDLGNSRCKCARLDATGKRGDVLAFGHRDGVDIDALLAAMGPVESGGQVWLASVAPTSFRDAAVAALAARGVVVHVVGTLLHCRHLRIAYAQPEHLGVDRFLALLAVSERKDGPWLLVSAGSAVTVDLLAPDGRHLGGLITLSPDFLREALGQRIAQLDMPPGQASDFADDTADAIASGAFGAVLGLIERSRRLADARLGVPPRVILSGGGAEVLAPLLPFAVERSPWLVLDGLSVLAQSGQG